MGGAQKFEHTHTTVFVVLVSFFLVASLFLPQLERENKKSCFYANNVTRLLEFYTAAIHYFVDGNRHTRKIAGHPCCTRLIN
jgi:hypothetical protein